MLIKFSEEYKLQRPHHAAVPNSLLVLHFTHRKFPQYLFLKHPWSMFFAVH